MNPLDVVGKIPSLRSIVDESEAEGRRIVCETKSLHCPEEVIKTLRAASASTTDGWIVCAHSQGPRFLREGGDPAEWLKHVRFPTSGEGYCKSTDTAWHLIHLGAAGWQWTILTAIADPACITTKDPLVGRNGHGMTYEITYASVPLGSHFELRPVAQRFVGFRTI